MATMFHLTPKHRLLLAGLLVVLLGGVGWEVLRPRGTLYHGKGLRFWLNEYEGNVLRAAHNGFDREATERKQEAEEAIRAIGTNGLPLLLEMISARDSALKKKFISLTWRPPWHRLQPYTAENYRGKALYAFEFLGDKAAPAVPVLIADMRDADASVRAAAARALGHIGPPAEAAVSALVERLTDTEREVRGSSALSLGFIHRKPELVVNALMEALETQEGIEVAALATLGSFGKEAKRAVPSILPSLDSSSELVRKYAAEALKAVDPEAAAKAGVK